MSNLRRENPRRIANRKRVVTISLLLSLGALVLGSPETLQSAQAASSVDGGVDTTSCTDPCFDPPSFSLDEASSPWVVVNKQRPLVPLNYKPKLVVVTFATRGHNPYGLMLAPEAAKAIALMFADAKKAGAGTLFLQSAYRSYDYQLTIHKRQVARLGKKAGEALAARAGYSEHQTGLAADLGAVGQGCLIQVCFAKTKAGRYLSRWAYKFGFIVRYPEGQTPITGYQFEPWHMRFVGVPLATEMHKRQVSVLENFWQLPAAANY